MADIAHKRTEFAKFDCQKRGAGAGLAHIWIRPWTVLFFNYLSSILLTNLEEINYVYVWKPTELKQFLDCKKLGDLICWMWLTGYFNILDPHFVLLFKSPIIHKSVVGTTPPIIHKSVIGICVHMNDYNNKYKHLPPPPVIIWNHYYLSWHFMIAVYTIISLQMYWYKFLNLWLLCNMQ